LFAVQNQHALLQLPIQFPPDYALFLYESRQAARIIKVRGMVSAKYLQNESGTAASVKLKKPVPNVNFDLSDFSHICRNLERLTTIKVQGRKNAPRIETVIIAVLSFLLVSARKLSLKSF
jgi:hypothetical protein